MIDYRILYNRFWLILLIPLVLIEPFLREFGKAYRVFNYKALLYKDLSRWLKYWRNE